MKVLFIVSVFYLVALSCSVPHNRGCIYAYGQCYQECPEGTHSYTPNYSSPWTYEPSCEDPNPAVQSDYVYDYSMCYCDPPTVRDKASGTCVSIDRCPQKKEV